MDQPPDDPVLGIVQLVVLAASAAAWIAIIQRWRRGEPALKYEPRTPVPWGVPVAMLAVVFVAISLLAPSDVDAPTPPEGLNPLEVSQRLISFILFQSAVIAAILFLVAVIYRATPRDFGLPEYAHDLVRDIRIGIIACLAALAPVYGVQLLMLYLFGPSEHPLVDMVTSGQPNVGVVFLATVAAVVVAPVGEEILFRLVLQGWLEKIEDQWRERLGHLSVRLRFRVIHLLIGTALMATVLMLMTLSFVLAIIALVVVLLAAGIFFYSLHHKPAMTSVDRGERSMFVEEIAQEDVPLTRDMSTDAVNGPNNWPSILVSSLLFAIAHFGYGPDPIAIFFLALILGYLYQRTHRIVPCIVAHAMFNSLAMFILWRMMFLHAE